MEFLFSLRLRDCIYLVLAAFLSSFVIVGWSIFMEHRVENQLTELQDQLEGKRGSAAITILEEARTSGLQKGTFQIRVSSLLAKELLGIGAYEEAAFYYEEVVFTRTKLIGDLFYDLHYFDDLKILACLSLVRLKLGEENYEDAQYFLELQGTFQPFFGCGTSAIQYLNEVDNLKRALSYSLEKSLFFSACES